MTNDPDLTSVTSVLDYVFRRLALDFLDEIARSQLHIYNLDEENRQLIEAGSLRKRTTDHSQLHNGPAKVHTFKVPCLT